MRLVGREFLRKYSTVQVGDRPESILGHSPVSEMFVFDSSSIREAISARVIHCEVAKNW